MCVVVVVVVGGDGTETVQSNVEVAVPLAVGRELRYLLEALPKRQVVPDRILGKGKVARNVLNVCEKSGGRIRSGLGTRRWPCDMDRPRRPTRPGGEEGGTGAVDICQRCVPAYKR